MLKSSWKHKSFIENHVLLCSANFLPQQTGKIPNKNFSVPWPIKEIFLEATNKIKQPIFRGRDMVNIFFGSEQTNHHSHPAALYLLPRPPPQSRPAAAELEAFCQIVFCVNATDAFLFLRSAILSHWHSYSLRAKYWTLKTQKCSGEFYIAPTEMRLLWNSQCCCSGSCCLFWVILNRTIILLLHTAQRQLWISWKQRPAGSHGGNKYRQGIIITRCNGIQSIPPSAALRQLLTSLVDACTFHHCCTLTQYFHCFFTGFEMWRLELSEEKRITENKNTWTAIKCFPFTDGKWKQPQMV